MCCLFGLADCRRSLTARQKNRVLSVLAAACEARGADATGIAYSSGGRLRVYKRPWPGRRMRFAVPGDARAVMGHTRMATQGCARRNRNNHPFQGTAGGLAFALAHNGVLYNDQLLRRTLHLPDTRIETDSYVAVQLLEQERTLGFAGLRRMAEQVRGSFTFTVLDERDSLYFVRGDNPMCIYHYPGLGLYLYASTEEILMEALRRMQQPLGIPAKVPLYSGEILRIDAGGAMAREWFDSSALLFRDYPSLLRRGCGRPQAERLHAEELRSLAGAFGCTPEDVDTLLAGGASPDEIEEYFCCREF